MLGVTRGSPTSPAHPSRAERAGDVGPGLAVGIGPDDGRHPRSPEGRRGYLARMDAERKGDADRPLPDAYYRQQEQLREEKKPVNRLRRRLAPIKTLWDTLVGDGTS